jgi:hypothetical protein
MITINEKVNLTEQQYQVLKTICDTYQMSLSEYMQQAIVEAMRFDIVCDALLEKIGAEDSKKDTSPSTSTPLAPGFTNSDLDLLKKLQTKTNINVGRKGVEPLTFRLSVERSTKLSYRPVNPLKLR